MAHPYLTDRQDTLNQLWETSDHKKGLPEFPAKDAAKLLFLAVNPEKVARCGNTEYLMDETIQRLRDKFETALTQKSMIPVQREVQVKLLKLYAYKISSQFSLRDDYISPEEEEILEINEIIGLLGHEPQTELQRKADTIILNKRINAPRTDPDDKTTFFVYAENKVIMDICDALSPQDVISLYNYMRRKEKDPKYEEEMAALSFALSIPLCEKSLIEIPGLKDVAFYLLIILMKMGNQLLNRLYTHKLEHMLIKAIPTIKEDPRLKSLLPTLQRYPISSRPPGLCVIFCMLEGRSGAREDLENVSKTFEDVFNFDVKRLEDPSAEEIEYAIKALDDPKSKFYDSLVVFFMGHGSESSLFIKNGEIQRKRQFIDPIISTQWFVDKPKVFFIQACSTDDNLEKNKEKQTSSALYTDTDTKSFGVIASPSWKDNYVGFTDFFLSNTFADTIVSYATMWRQKAARQKDGSLYINTLIEKLREYGSSESIENVLRRVHYYVSMVQLTEDNEVSWKQAPYFESSLKKEFILPHRKNRS